MYKQEKTKIYDNNIQKSKNIFSIILLIVIIQ